MVEKIEAFRDSTGAVHTSACAAYTAELVVFFMQTGDLSEASARSLAKKLASDLTLNNQISDLLSDLRVNCCLILEPEAY